MKSSRCGGKEVYEVPLCAACVVESEVDGVREESAVVQTGLRRVERVDGGLTRRRWETKEVEKRGLTSSTILVPSHKSSGDGTGGEEAKACNTTTKPTDPSESVIWVDIFDPINGPSFKPSPLKPIPLFMQRPPNPALVAQRQPHPADVHLQTPPPLSKSASAPCSVYPSASPVTSLRLRTHNTSQPTVPIPAGPAYRSPTPSRGHDARLPPAPPSEYIADTGSLDLRHKQAFTLVKEEPLKRPSSRLAPSRRRSDANSSAYRTPPEYPDQVMRIPYPLPLSTVRAASPLPSQLTSHSQRIANAAPQSSEYLERYQPVTAAVRTTEARRLRRVTASLSEENSGRGRSEQMWSDDAGDWGRVGAELRRFFTRR